MNLRVVRALRSGEDGVSLLLAIIFIAVVGLVVAALLPYTSAGIRAANTATDVRSIHNAVDGAMDQAINAIRGSLTLGTPGNSCPTYVAPPYTAPAPIGGSTNVRVSCVSAGGTSTFDDQPPFAIQTLIGGIDVQGNAPLMVDGSVFSTGGVTTAGPQQTLVVNGDLYSKGACASDIVVSGVARCTNTTPAYSAGTDPAGDDPLAGSFEPLLPGDTANPVPRSAETGTALAADPLGTCAPGPRTVVQFSPGFYSETPVPDPLTCSGNGHKTWWFPPGVYYFDFPQALYGAPYTDGMAEWDIPNYTVIAGTPKGWDPGTTDSDDVRDLMPLACDLDQPGSVFVFGGPTNITIASLNRLEICPRQINGAAGKKQFISLYGWRGTFTRSPAAPLTGPIQPSTATSAVADFLLPDNAKAIDTAVSTATLIGGSKETAKITLSGFAPAIPDGSLVTQFHIRVKHSENTNELVPQLKISSLATPTLTPVSGLSRQASLTEQTLTPTLPANHRWKSLKDLVVEYSVDGSGLCSGRRSCPVPETGIATLDGIELDITYVPPALEGARCISSPCDLLTNTVTDRLYLHGTVYTPASSLTVAVHNFSTTVFERGVICGSLVAKVSPSTKQTESPFQLPLKGGNRVVLFTAQAQEPDGSWKTRLVALVRYDDAVEKPGNKSTARPGNVVTVLRWTVVR